MTHDHGSHAGKCDCGCDHHSNHNNYVFIPTQNYGSPCMITGSEINWMTFLFFWGVVAYGLYVGGFGALESVLLAPLVMLLLVVVLAAAVGAVIWLIFTVAKLIRRSSHGIQQDKVTYEYLYEGKKQKPKSKWSEASLILFLTIAMALCLLLDKIYF